MIPRGRRSRLFLILLIGPWLLTSQVSAAAGANAANLISVVGAARSALAAGEPGLAERDLLGVASAFPAATVVIGELKQGQLTQARAELSWLVSAFAPVRRAPTSQTIRSTVRSIYQSPDLAALSRRTPPGQSLLSALATDVQQLLASLFSLVGTRVWIVIGLALLLIGAAALAVTLHRTRRVLVQPTPAPPGAPAPGAAVRPEHLFARAETLREEGRFRDAVRLSFQALLLSVTNRRLLKVEPSWTNTELLRAARTVSDLEPQLQPLVSQFNAVVYGGRELVDEGCTRFTAACRTAAGVTGR